MGFQRFLERTVGINKITMVMHNLELSNKVDNFFFMFDFSHSVLFLMSSYLFFVHFLWRGSCNKFIDRVDLYVHLAESI